MLRNLIGLIALFLFAQITRAQAPPTGYDSTLAHSLGADDYGMRMYSLVMLKAGPRTDLTKAERDSVFAGHMANIQRLAAEGQLFLAGPFGKNDRYEGLFVFNTRTVEATEALLHTDPAVASGALAYEVYPWYGSASVQQIPALHKRLQKKDF